jgi:fermentation-respiration switch protein FrsA (DUF1100 family)
MKIKLVVISVVIIILVIAYFAAGNYFYNYALKAKDKKEFLQNNPNLSQSKAVNTDLIEKSKLADKDFAKLHLPSQVSIVSRDKLQLKLNAYVYENSEAKHKWAILVHGYTGRAEQMSRWVRNFYERGYSVLAPDLRGHGKSEGNYIGMGWHDRLDMLLWINKILEKDPTAEIALFGISMGGATVMMTSGEELPSNVKVIVEDCGYTSVSDVFTYQLDDLFHLPEFPVMTAANTVTNLRAGYDLYKATAVGQIAKSKTPTLFIHGDKDTFVPYEMLDKVYEAAAVEKEKLVIKGAGHGQAATVDPELYWSTIWNFVEKYIK